MPRRTRFSSQVKKTQYLGVSLPREQEHSTLSDLRAPVGLSLSLAVRLVVRWVAAADPAVVRVLALGAQGAMQVHAPRSAQIAQGDARVQMLADYLGQSRKVVVDALSPRPHTNTVIRCTLEEHDAVQERYTIYGVTALLPRVVWVAFCLNFPTRAMLYQQITEQDRIINRHQLEALISQPDSHEVSDDDLTILAGKRPKEWGTRSIWNERTTDRLETLAAMLEARYGTPLILGPDDVVVPDAEEVAGDAASQNPS